MKSNKEEVERLKGLRDAEVKLIEDKWNLLIEPLYEKFTVEDLNNLGWMKGDFYGAGDQYLFKKGKVEIRVYPKDLKGDLWCMTYWESPGFQFVDLAHIEDYYNSKQK